MARYVEVSQIVKELLSITITDDLYGEGIKTGVGQALKIIEEVPTADVVKVVRCPECIYCENMKCTELRDNTGNPLDVAVFDYCSQGVRK